MRARPCLTRPTPALLDAARTRTHIQARNLPTTRVPPRLATHTHTLDLGHTRTHPAEPPRRRLVITQSQVTFFTLLVPITPLNPAETPASCLVPHRRTHLHSQNLLLRARSRHRARRPQPRCAQLNFKTGPQPAACPYLLRLCTPPLLPRSNLIHGRACLWRAKPALLCSCSKQVSSECR